MPNIALIEGNKLSDSGSDLTAISGQTYSRLHSGRDFPNGTLIETTIDYSLTNGDPWVLEITGNAYFSLIPFDLKYQGYIYNNTVTSQGGISVGAPITGMSLFNYNGKLCFWFPYQSYWQGFNVYAYSALSGRKENRVTAITNVAKPAGVTKEVSMTFQQVVRTSSSTVGTTNYVSKFSANNVLTDSQIFDNGTNVGIGTASPGAKLEVAAGHIKIADAYSFYWGAGTTSINGNSNANFISLWTNNLTRLHITSAGDVGINTTTPSGKLDVVGASSYFGIGSSSDTFLFLRGYNGGLIRFQSNSGFSGTYNGLGITTNSNGVNSLPSWNFDFGGQDGVNFLADAFSIYRKPNGGSYTGLFAILSSGETLVGRTTAVGSHRLQVNGNISINGSGSYLDFQNGDVRLVNSGGNLSIQTYSATTTLTTKVYISGTGNVGINTSDPDSTTLRIIPTSTDAIQRTLHIGYNGSMSTGTHGSLITFGNTTPSTAQLARIGAFYEGSTYMGSLRFYTNSDTEGANPSEKMRITQAGNVGIGATNPGSIINTGAFFKPETAGEHLDILSSSSEAVLNLRSNRDTNNGQVGGIYFTRDGGQGDAHRHIGAIQVRQSSTGNLAGGSMLFFTKPTSSGAGVDAARMTIDSAGGITIASLAGTGTRIVTADANGFLAATTVSSSLVGGSGTVNRVAKFTATGTVGDSQIFDNGTSVGIGTNSPSFKLDVQGGLANFAQTASSGSAFRWGSYGTAVSPDTMLCMNQLWNGSGWTYINNTVGTTAINLGSAVASPDIKFDTGGAGVLATTKVIILNNGNVGIGTTAPSYNLQVGSGTTAGNRTLAVQDSGYGVMLSGGGGAANNYIQSIGTTIPLYFRAGNSNDANYIFSSTGRMGIGSTSPGGRVHIRQAASEIPLIIDSSVGTNSAFTQYQVNASSGWEVGMAGSGDSFKWFYSYGGFGSANAKVAITSGGNFGIGQVSPQRPLHITTANGTASQIQIGQTSQRDYYIGIPASQTYLDFYDASAGASRMAVFSDGNVAINTLTNAGYKFDVNGTTRFGGTTTFNSTFVHRNFNNIIISDLSASATQARQFEILRGFYDYNDWSPSGVVEIEVYENYYSRGLKKVYTFSYGYFDSSSLFLTEMTGTGDNTFRVTMGAKVLISGDMYYVPVYLEVRAYGRVDVIIRTRRAITTNNLSTTPGALYVNESPTAVNISDFTSDTIVYPNNAAVNQVVLGNLGVGSNPSYKLDVNGITRFRNIVRFKTNSWNLSDDGQSRFYFDNASSTFYGTASSHIWRNGSDITLMTLNSSGNLGVGTITPNARIEVSESTNAAIVVRQNTAAGNNKYAQIILSHGTTFFGASDKSWQIVSNGRVSGEADLGFQYWNGSTYAERVTILNSGNVGIGTTAPQKPLEVITNPSDFASVGVNQIAPGQWTGIHFGYREANTLYRKSAIVFERTDLTANNAQGKVHILNGPQGNANSATLADAKITIAENGNVGIGTTSPASTLDVRGVVEAGTGTIRTVLSYTGTGGVVGTISNHPLILYANNDERVRITNTGNVGIGTTVPTNKLDVLISTASGDFIGNTNVYALAIKNNDTTAGNAVAITFGQGGFTYTNFIASVRTGTGSNPAGDLVFGGRPSDGVGFVERLRIASTGVITIGNLAGTGTRMVVADANGLLSTQAIPSGGGGSGTVTSVGLTVGSSGTDVNVSNSPITTSGNITLNIPDASATARGLVTTGTQTFAGDKTFTGTTTLNSTRTSITNGSYGMYMLTTYNIATATSNVNVYTSVDALTLNLTNGALTGNETFNVTANLNQVSVAGNAGTVSTQPIRGIISGLLGIPGAIAMNIADYRYFEAKTPDRAALTGHIVQTMYGLKISQLKGATGFTITNSWGIYQEGTQENNYFAGNVIVGSTTVGSYKLDVTNNFRVNTGTVPVAIESFSNPGIGTVASVYSTGTNSTIAFGSQANDTYLVGGYVFIGNQSAKFMIQADTLTGGYDGWGSIGSSAKYMKEVYTNYLVDKVNFNRQTASYTLVSGDRSKVIEMNVGSANTLTVPTNASVAFPVGTKITIIQYGAGQTTIGGAGVTFRSRSSWLKISAQYGRVQLIKVGTDEWYVLGDLAA